MERGRHSSSFDSSVWISTLSPDTVNYYIMYADTLIEQCEEPIFEVSIIKFKDFVEKEYQIRYEACEEQEFLNNIFEELFVKNSERIKTLTTLKLCEAIIEIDLGSKVTKASRIAQEIGTLKPTDDPKVFNSLRNILRWMNKILRVSIQLVIEPLIDSIWHWNDSNDRVALLGSFMLFSLLYELFPFCFASHARNIVETFIHGIQTEFEDVRSYAQQSLQLLKKDTISGEKCINLLVTYIHKVVCEAHPEEIYALHEFIDILYSFKPENQFFVESKELPFNFLKSTDKIQRLAGLIQTTFMLGIEPNYYNSFTYEKVLNCILPMLKKRSLVQGQGSIFLGKIVFQREGKFSESEKTILNSMKPFIFKFLSCPPCAFAYLSLLTTNIKKFRKNLLEIFKLSISSLMIDGLIELTQIFPTETEFIHQQFIQYANGILFNRNYTPQQIILIFDALSRLDMEKVLPLELILQYSMFMMNPNLEIRTQAANFIIKCHNYNPTEDTAIRIITSISRENDHKLCQRMITQMVKLPVAQSILPCLQTLFVISSKRVKTEVFNYCVKFIENPAGLILLNEYLSEELNNLQNEGSDRKKIATTFLSLFDLTKNEDPVVSKNAKMILMPFLDHLYDILCSIQGKINNYELRILTYIIQLSPQNLDIDRLTPILKECINVSYSIKHLTIGLKLIYTILFYTGMKDSISSRDILPQLISISMMSTTTSEIHYLLLKIFSLYGPIAPNIINSISNTNMEQRLRKELSPFKYVASSSETDPLESIVDASFSIAITCIVNLLSDESLVTLHSPSIEALMTILKSGHKFSDYAKDQLINCVENTILHSNLTTISIFISNISIISNALKDSFKSVIPVLVKFICQRWKQIDSLQLIQLFHIMMQNYRETVTPFIPSIADLFVDEFDNKSPLIIQRIVDIILSFGPSVNDVAHIVFPPILTWLYNNATDTKSCNYVLQDIVYILIDSHCESYNAMIIQTLINIASVNPALKDKSILVLVAIAINVGRQFLLYIPALHDTFDIRSNPVMMKILPYLEEGFEYTQDILNFGKASTRKTLNANPTMFREFAMTKSFSQSNYQVILKLPSTQFSENDWTSWSNDTFMRIVHASVSEAITACEILIQKYPPLREVFFSLSIAMNYVKEMDEKVTTMSTVLKTFFASETTPQSLSSIFLSAVEIIEVAGLYIPVPLNLVSNQAIKAGRFSQGLRALEKLYENGDREVLGQLMRYNRILSHPFTYYNESNQTLDIDNLKKWSKESNSSDNFTLHDLSDSDNIFSIKNPHLFSQLKFKELLESTPKDSVHHASALWGLFEMEDFAKTAKKLQTDDIDSLFYRAVYCVLQEQTAKAKEIIERVQHACADKIIPTLFHDYNRGFHNFSLLTRFSELEEIIYYHELEQLRFNSPELKSKLDPFMKMIVNKWQNRFNYYAEDLNVLQTSLQIHSLIFKDEDTHLQWKRLLQSSLDQKYIEYCENLLPKLVTVLTPTEDSFYCAQVNYAKDNNIKYNDIDLSQETDPTVISSVESKIGGWLVKSGRITEGRQHIFHAKNVNQNDPLIWKQWAMVNNLIYLSYHDEEANYNSFEASLKGLELTRDDHVSFLLRIQNILFKDSDDKIYKTFIDHYKNIQTHKWLIILQQMIVHSNSDNENLKCIIENLLIDCSNKHPHAILQAIISYVLNLEKANKLLKTVYDHISFNFPELTRDTFMMCKEFGKMAIVWAEKYQRLTNTILESYANKNLEKCQKKLKKVFNFLDKKPQNFYEVSFIRNFGHQLMQSRNWMENYLESKDQMHFENVISSLLFDDKQLDKSIPLPRCVMLKDFSKYLDSAVDLHMVMPGTYDPEKNNSNEYIQSISKEVAILNNKNRRRLLNFVSNTGRHHLYSLGNDVCPRLDVNIMHLFNLINSIIDHSTTVFSTKVSMTTFHVLPIKKRIGLIGWIPQSETLLRAVSTFRQRHNIKVNTEYLKYLKRLNKIDDFEETKSDNESKKLKKNSATNSSSVFDPRGFMTRSQSQNLLKVSKQKVTEDDTIIKLERKICYEDISDEDKLYAFNESMKTTKGDDVKKLLLINANSSKDWITRRVEFTVSLAIGSVVGYVIFLGNRNPSNILMNINSARISHINFSSALSTIKEEICADSGKQMPFRLTRMFINALELSKTEGSFQHISEAILSLLQQNKEDILSILEIFVKDPSLISRKSGTNIEEYISGVEKKLDGYEYPSKKKLSVTSQINKLIRQATNTKNICSMPKYWNPWW
ncbi:PIKK family atypical protein kinase [Trichomonas vaginalis G3]|uniref:PIKK family atypical protein kinase n=1 Tax=Trichomonas vaginalis (strain ATCC PRA-98 / G3) TaxID=412133 RepID=A2DJR1_TRIV3|nr:ataxia telangiectasia mutated (ATM) -related family [Trichomonas vaginalis G3]EAY19275.1 PIKK family atypical protein kinase [Trichomonas vaginalis G3]KAI5527177.1 ataxia telangiectasia mutated (ATM) -related family [Trichomonas vaginalis G3]|eukprot:XP_001580261.1 PIKK family atypical protein kinase [Trichomonas vaginalis G3]